MSKASTKNKASRKKLRKLIPVEEAIARWCRDPEYVKEYNALEEEFALVSEIIKARAAAGLNSGRTRQAHEDDAGCHARISRADSYMPSTRTLKRFAAATGHSFKIRFEPSNA